MHDAKGLAWRRHVHGAGARPSHDACSPIAVSTHSSDACGLDSAPFEECRAHSVSLCGLVHLHLLMSMHKNEGIIHKNVQ